MSSPVDKTVVQPPADAAPVDATIVESQRVQAEGSVAAESPDIENKTVVAGTPGLDGHDAGAHEHPAQVASAEEGMVLKQRFELVELLGSGGMGAVFKARDLRQVEAGDADPWVAVKVINESFARHEHALVSLQQETKKTQRLSHPNIVSAYDFDRDGDIAFMTMELLQGQSLDQLLQQNKSGLSESRALHILRQVTEAVAYAHQQGIVHADLKPANIFITQSGQVKVLDFGIARAVYAESNTINSAAIQAFTPAYASVKVLSGAMPEPLDDLYALGCIFYMLFTGEHPYRRCKATEADAAGMKAKRISELDRSQWKALASLMSFHPQPDLSIEHFRKRFFGDQTHQSRRLAAVSISALVLIMAGLLVLNWFNHREHRAVVTLLSSTETRVLQQGVTRLADFNDDDRAVILDSARETVLENLQQQLSRLAFAPDYQTMQNQLAMVTKLYPDSSALLDLAQRFDRSRQSYVADLSGEITRRIEDHRYQESDPDFSTLLQRLRLVEPEHALFAQHDFRTLLAREAGLAVYMGHRPLAEAIVEQALVLFPQDRPRFEQVLARATSANASTDSTQQLNGNLKDQGLADYKQAVEMAQNVDLSDPEQLRNYLGELQLQNPSMYQVLSSGLQTFLQKHNLRDRELAALKKSLAPVRKAPRQTVRRDPCRASLANRGADSRYGCRDRLTSSVKGPELVVVRGDRSQPSFAVGRTEVTVADYNHYCRLYRVCTPRPDSRQPVTNLSYRDAKGYVQWLSKMTGYRYSLPTVKQWRLMARDDSGISDHNCKVYTGGRWIRGGELRAASEGYQNSLGIRNLFGNAGEWVRSGNNLFIAGGDANTVLDQCSADTLIPGAADAAPLVGFRVVRAVN